MMIQFYYCGIILALLTLLILTPSVYAAKIHGRITLGSFVSTERFKNTDSGSENNDFLMLSSRFYLRGSEIGKKKWTVVTDLRDKYDFFDQLSSSRQQLEEKNTLQVRQLSLQTAKLTSRTGLALGRFPVQEAGAVNVDGLSLTAQSTPNLSFGFFGGLNPKTNDQTALTWNGDAQIYGTYLQYAPTNYNIGKSLFLSAALVRETYSSEVDRQYFYQSFYYQWNLLSRLMAHSYYDYGNRTYLQNGSLLWQQGWGRSFISSLQYISVDTVEYTRRRGIRETLTPSAYQEFSISGKLLASKHVNLLLGHSRGEREFDQLTTDQIFLAGTFPQLGAGNFDAFAKIGHRNHFTSSDNFLQCGLGYFTDQWEVNLNADYSKEDYPNGTSSTPIVLEGSLSNYLSQRLFTSISVQQAQDDKVTILSAFFKIGYRFGNHGIAPIRDGAPPRGRL